MKKEDYTRQLKEFGSSEDVQNNIIDEIDRYLNNDTNLQSLVLSSHLIMEVHLEHFIIKKAKDSSLIEKKMQDYNMTFRTKLMVAQILGLNLKIHEGIKELNHIRNNMAHKVEWNKDIIKPFIRKLKLPKDLTKKGSIEEKLIFTTTVYCLALLYSS